MAEEKTAVDLAWDEMAGLVVESQTKGMTFTKYLRQLEQEADAAARKLELARSAAGLCEATKLRKPRVDRGKPRKPRPAGTGGSSGSGGEATHPDPQSPAEPPAGEPTSS